jgi:hypothetical protein
LCDIVRRKTFFKEPVICNIRQAHFFHVLLMHAILRSLIDLRWLNLLLSRTRQSILVLKATINSWQDHGIYKLPLGCASNMDGKDKSSKIIRHLSGFTKFRNIP